MDQEKPTPFTMQTDHSSLPEASSSEPATPLAKPPKGRRKLLYIVAACCGIVVVAGVAAFLLMRETPSNTKTAKQPTPAASASYGAPRYSAINSYASFKGAEWYAVLGGVIKVTGPESSQIFTQQHGVPYGTPTKLVVHKDRLWLSAQNGVAMLNDAGTAFVEVPVGGKKSTDAQTIENGTLYHDTSADTLYLSTFNDLYEYQDDKNTWARITLQDNATLNASTFAANKDFVIWSGHGSGSDDQSVWVRSKKGNQWKLTNPATIKDQTAQLFTIDGNVFIAGRTQGYTSCDSVGKVVATSVYKLDQNGTWQPETVFNNDLKRPELRFRTSLKTSNITAVTSNCSNDNKQSIFTASITNGALQVGNETPAVDSDDHRYNSSEQRSLIDTLNKATGLHAYMRVFASDKNGNAFVGYTDQASSSSQVATNKFAIANKGKLRDLQELSLAKSSEWSVVQPIVCDGSFTHLFIGTEEAGEGPTGNWDNAKLYTLQNNVATEFVDLGKDVANPRFACDGKRITWVGKGSVKILTIDTKQIQNAGKPFGVTADVYSSDTRIGQGASLWYTLATDPGTEKQTTSLHYFDANEQTNKQITSVQGRMNLLAADTAVAWVNSTTNKSERIALTAYNTAGTKLTGSEYARQVAGAVIGSNQLLLAVPRSDRTFTAYDFSTLTTGGQSKAVTSDGSTMNQLYGWQMALYDPIVFSADAQTIFISDDYQGIVTLKL